MCSHDIACLGKRFQAWTLLKIEKLKLQHRQLPLPRQDQRFHFIDGARSDWLYPAPRNVIGLHDSFVSRKRTGHSAFACQGIHARNEGDLQNMQDFVDINLATPIEAAQLALTLTWASDSQPVPQTRNFQ